MHYALAQVTAPVSEPITLEDTKAFLRIDGEFDNDHLQQLIATARRHFDGKDAWFGRALISQTWDLYLDGFPSPPLRLPLPPLQSVTSIQYIDPAGALQTWPPSEYVVDIYSDPGRIVPAYGTSWPDVQAMPSAVIIRFVAGYGTHHQVPDDIKTWLKQAVAYFYERREATELPGGFYWSLARYKAAWSF
jgi:uncharacterized phiE125 gp8 family phage protein